MNWKEYEKEVYQYFKTYYPGSSIKFDRKIIGKFSKVHRQIDILIESKFEGQKQTIIVDCKFFSKKIDIKLIESFSSMVADVEADQAILITNIGYSKAAINRAHYGNENIELDIINFEAIKKFQGYVALPYVGQRSVSLLVPFGWILDLESSVNNFAVLHQRGITLKEAKKKGEWMYVNFWIKKEKDFSIDNLIEVQNDYMQKDLTVNFRYLPGAKRLDDTRSKIRIAEVDSYSSLEVTGFLEFEDVIFFIVLFTPNESLDKNIRKLAYILTMATPMNINFDNSKVIKQLLERSKKVSDKEGKANMFYEIANWYKEMDNMDDALSYYKKSIDYFPGHYSSLRQIIFELVVLKEYEEAENYAKKFFHSSPTNPKVFEVLIDVYMGKNRPDLLEVFLEKLLIKTDNDETIGNISFHQGQLAVFQKKEKTATKYFQTANKHFEKSLPKNHHVFRVLQEYQKQITN